MILTNTQGLPASLVEAVRNDPYDPGDSWMTASKLGSPPQLIALERMFGHVITVDVTERIWALFGQGVHAILERSDPSELKEQRLYAEFRGRRIGARYDAYHLNNALLQEYKVTSVWTVIYGERFKEWADQMCVQQELIEQSGLPVERMEAVVFLRDWAISEYERSLRAKSGISKGNYPPQMVVTVPIPRRTKEERVAWIEQRVAAHQAVEGMSAGELAEHSPCTPAERWYNPKTKKFNRCERYCPARSVCAQFNSGGK